MFPSEPETEGKDLPADRTPGSQKLTKERSVDIPTDRLLVLNSGEVMGRSDPGTTGS